MLRPRRAWTLSPASIRRYAFGKRLTYANHVGLFAEESGPTGEQLGSRQQGSNSIPPQVRSRTRR
ncbi:hypothetical protein [Streptomyces sp. NPDC058371]|uniref:hypothetical protein n=1 Tax=Streptomyces sp. NPDC058371 TaxID=3346463 RepID=UPI003664390F